MRPPGSATASLRAASAALLALLAAAPAFALLRMNDGRDQIYVTAYVGAGYDSNIYTSANAEGDMILSGGAGIEYARKAGLIGVNASLGWDFGNYSSNSSEDFLNPAMTLEFSKGTGRTTGGLQLNARQETRADPTIGLITDSWNYGVNLNYRYPVIERYSIAGGIGWQRTDYEDTGATFADQDLYSFNVDLLYSWRSDRDLLMGYRHQFTDTSATSESYDHTVYVGVTGRIVGKLSGSARVGWTYRTTEYPPATLISGTTASIAEDSEDGLYVSIAGTWPATHKATFTLSLTQDFSTTSTNFQTQTTNADLSGQFSHTVKFSTRANIGGGYTDYLSGFANNSPTYSPGFNNLDRADHYVTAGVGASYVFNAHLTGSVYYTHYQNWSSLSSYEFTRHMFGVTVSTRW